MERDPSNIAQANDTSVEQDVKYELTQCWKRLVSDEYELIEREVLEEVEETANADNCAGIVPFLVKEAGLKK